MIKTLRITSIAAAVLAVVFFVSAAIFGFRSDKGVEEFLDSPGVIKKFREAKGDRAKRIESQISPLVNQAEAFASYLNPPKPTPRKPEPARTRTSLPTPRTPVSPKFKLIGTSRCASNPEMSLALIDEPGKGLHWVKQSSEVGRLVIEQVKNGAVVVRDGERTFELAVPRPAKTSLLKSSSSAPTGSKSTPAFTETGDGITGGHDFGVPQTSDEEREAIEKIFSELEAMAKEAMRISAEEAEKLGHLGKELEEEDIRQDPNRVRGLGDKIEVSRRGPNSPEEK